MEVAVSAVWLVVMGAWIVAKRPPARRWLPLMTTPLPWIAFWGWAMLNARNGGEPPKVAAPFSIGLLAVGVTFGLSIWALVEAEGIRIPASGLLLMNLVFACGAALIGSMTVSGAWL